MSQISRRGLMTTAAATCLGTSWAQSPAPAAPPVARVAPVTEDFWGTKVTDPYRWMESKDAEWKKYIEAEGDYAAKILAAIPGRNQIAAAVSHYSGALEAVVSVQRGGDLLFVERRPAGGSLTNLYIQHGLDGTAKLLIDPTKFPLKGSHYAMDWWVASPDGSHVTFGISPGGNEQSILHVIEVATGKLLPEQIDRCGFGGVSWLRDSSGFFYIRNRPGISPESQGYEEYLTSWFHRLGSDPAHDVKVIDAQTAPALKLGPIDYPFVATDPSTDLAFAQIVHGTNNEVAIYFTAAALAAAGKPDWRPICSPADKVTGFSVLGNDIFLLTHQNASRYRVVKTSAPNPSFSNAMPVVPESSRVIRSISAARDGLYIEDRNGAVGALRKLGTNGWVSEIKLPFSGTLDMLYTDTLHDGALFTLEGWVRAPVLCATNGHGAAIETAIAPKPPFDLSVYTSEEVSFAARDGVKVPLSIFYRKGLKRDGQAPLLLEAYGAYGISLDPAFSPRWLPLLDLGGVFAVAHVRGGGELGEDWHLAGKMLTKPNTWRDTIDAAEYLIAQHYTSKAKLGIYSRSAGGITVGMFMAERPDLAAVVISGVGVSNPLRSEFTPNGAPNIPEFGSVKTKEGFQSLYAMDTTQHIKKGVAYPSVLILSGLNDPRVEPWEPTKLAAWLQASTSSKNPILLRLDRDSGHGFGSTRQQRDQETADVIAFLLWRTGSLPKK